MFEELEVKTSQLNVTRSVFLWVIAYILKNDMVCMMCDII